MRLNTGTDNDSPESRGAGDPLADRLIRDLVDAHPATLQILAPLGLDLCCGGGHPLGTALDLHGIPRQPVLDALGGLLAAERQEA